MKSLTQITSNLMHQNIRLLFHCQGILGAIYFFLKKGILGAIDDMGHEVIMKIRRLSS